MIRIHMPAFLPIRVGEVDKVQGHVRNFLWLETAPAKAATTTTEKRLFSILYIMEVHKTIGKMTDDQQSQ